MNEIYLRDVISRKKLNNKKFKIKTRTIKSLEEEEQSEGLGRIRLKM